MRIGESRLAQARERRWSRPYNSLDPAVVQLEQEERARVSGGQFVSAWPQPIALHVVLFFIVFPSYYEEKILKVGSTPRVFRLRQVQFAQPPKPKVQRTVTRPKARKIPVPDATPDDPEPIIREESVDMSDLDFPEVGDSVVDSAGPGRAGHRADADQRQRARPEEGVLSRSPLSRGGPPRQGSGCGDSADDHRQGRAT